MSFIGSNDFFTEVAKGKILGHSIINKFGRNPDCDQIASVTAVTIGRDIWDLGINGATMWVPPTTARTHQISSNSIEDGGGAGGDTGALTVRVFGLDSAYALQQEDIIMDGTGDVATASPYTMIHRMEVLTTGSAGRNLGNIDATADTDTTVTARITINNNQTKMAIFQIPAATTGLLYGYDGSIHKAGGAAKLADITIMLQDFGGPWRAYESLDVTSDGLPYAHHPYVLPIQLPAKSYVKMVANPSADAQDISASFDIMCVED